MERIHVILQMVGLQDIQLVQLLRLLETIDTIWECIQGLVSANALQERQETLVRRVGRDRERV